MRSLRSLRTYATEHSDSELKGQMVMVFGDWRRHGVIGAWTFGGAGAAQESGGAASSPDAAAPARRRRAQSGGGRVDQAAALHRWQSDLIN